MVVEYISHIFNRDKSSRKSGVSFDEKTQKAAFFRTKQEFKSLANTEPSHFILSLPERHLMIQMAGAARDSFIALNDTERSEKFLEILKDSFWEKHGFKGTPIEHISNATAFLMVQDGNTLEQEKPFLDFCEENGIKVTEKDIEESKKKYKQPADNV